LEEIAVAAGFQAIRVVQPITETGYPVMFDSQVMSHEWESSPESPHTLLIEAKKG
jgi:hypothetical protein